MAGRKGQRSGGHNAKTTDEHKRDGTFQKCRHGKRLDNLPADGKPIKPKSLTKLQASLWDEMVDYLPDGCVGAADSVALREMCRWYELYSDAYTLLQSDPLDKDARCLAKDAFDRFWKIAQDFGATPVARTRLQIPEEKEDNPMAALNVLAASRA